MAITSINLFSLNGGNGFRLDGMGINDKSGGSVSNAGDINGDGFDDVIIGASEAGPNDESSGSSYVLFGKASGFDAAMSLSSLDGSNGFRLDGEAAGDRSGRSVSNAGDVNGDGFDDLIIGAYGADPNGDASGSSYVVFGKATGFAAAVDLSGLDGNNGYRLDGTDAFNLSGVSVSGAGDINGDGFDDVIIGGRGSNDDYSSPVTVDYVVFGKASGFSPTFNLSDLNGSNGFHLDVDTYNASTASVSSAGDINGDGYADLIVGIVFQSNYRGALRGTESYVVFGKATGFDAAVNLSNLDGSNGFSLTGAGFGLYGGVLEVSDAGDINGDGFDDVIIGAPENRDNGYYSGSSYVVFGKASGFAADLNLRLLDGSNGFRLDGVAESDNSGRSASNAGDVNGDGFDDLIVGARADPYDISYGGASYVVFGKASGFGATMDLSSLDGEDGIRLDGVTRNDSAGASVSSAGDVNSDGFDDLIVGAPGADTNGSDSGASYVLFGSSNFTGTATFLGTPGDDTLTGSAAIERFKAGDGNDTMIGGGGTDLFDGEAGDDIIRVPDLDFQIVNGGTGNDTLELTGSGINLNLANFRGESGSSLDNTIRGLETIDLTGSGDNTLTVTEQDLLKLSDIPITPTNTLVIKGNAGDHVAGLSQGWLDGGVQGNFHAYIRHGATLLIDASVSTDPLTPSVISLSNLNGSNGFRLAGIATYGGAGISVSSAGDVNGDGFDDVIVGSPAVDPNGNFSASSYVVFGKTAGFAATLDLTSLDGSNGFRLDGVSGFRWGGSVSNAGDVNGDGFADVIIGAPGADPNGVGSGSSYVVFGKASGFDAAMALSSLDGSNGFRLDGVEEDDFSGASVSNAGDVNGDGFDDVIIGAPARYGSAASYVVFGKANGFDAAIDLSGLDGNNGFRLDGEAAGDRSGFSVSNAGDVNSDGFDDLIIGAYGADPNGFGSGSSYVVFGKASGFDAAMALSSLDGSNGFRLDGVAAFDFSGASVSNAGDVNGDGFDDVIIGARYADRNGEHYGPSYVVFGEAAPFDATLDLASLDGNNGFRVGAGDQASSSVSSAGDVNGDGFDDLIVGSNRYSDNSSSSHVVFGKVSGFSATLNLSSLDGSNGVRLDVEGSIDSVSGAGDVNDDGYDDLLIGASHATPNGNFSGSSYVIFGSRDFGGGQLPVISGTSSDDVLRGTSAAEIFEAGDGNDILIGRGGADVFRGGAGVDQIKVPDLNFASIDGGTGTDILHLDGKDLNLDLASFGDKIQGIETICIYGRGDNTLALKADSVLNLSDTSNTLKLHGNAGDHVTVQDDGWVDGGVKGFYHTYTNDDAVLLVGANLAIEFA